MRSLILIVRRDNINKLTVYNFCDFVSKILKVWDLLVSKCKVNSSCCGWYCSSVATSGGGGMP